MKFEARIVLEVDPDANFLEVSDINSCVEILELLENLIHDTDDVSILTCHDRSRNVNLKLTDCVIVFLNKS